MKNLYYLLLTVIIIGCSKKNNNVTPNATITGKWITVSDTIYSVASNGAREYVSGDNHIPGMYIQFNTDGSGLTYYPAWNGQSDETDPYTYTVSGKIITVHMPAVNTGNSHIPASSFNFNVLKLTDKVLITEIDESDVDDKGNTKNTQTIGHWSK